MTITHNVSITGVGLYASNTRESAFLRASPGYNSNADPRLPQYGFLTSNLTIHANAEIHTSNIDLYPDPAVMTVTSATSANIALGNLLVVPVDSIDAAVQGAKVNSLHIPIAANIKIAQIFSTNSSILLRGFTTSTNIAAGESIYFTDRVSVGSVRIKGEVIWYDRKWTANSALTNLTRNVASTTNATISGNVTAGNIVSILGLRTVSS